jgi:DNA polymerase III subunit delta'
VAPAEGNAVTLHPLRGHEAVRHTLLQAFRADALPQALLFYGARGIGKQRLALWLARLAVCEAPENGPCDSCGPCRMALSLEHPDIHWYFPLERPKGVSDERLADALERARYAELAELRETSVKASWTEGVRGIYLGAVSRLRSAAIKRPTMAEGPVFIIGQAEMLVPQESSPAAANALLKLLEEPPGAARFILTSSEPGRLLDTIRSRTVPLHVPSLSGQEVSDFLSEHADVDAKVGKWAATLGQGSPGRALGFLNDGDELGPLESLRRRAFDIVVAATSADVSAGYGTAIAFPPAGARKLLDLFSFVEEWLRDLAAVAAGADDLVFNRDALVRLRKHVASCDIAAVDVTDGFPAVERARELARGNVNPQLVVSGLVRELRRSLHDTHRLAGDAR